jgi:two-component system sensor histidine kinase BaeS
MRGMPLKIAHQLSLLLTAMVVLAVACVGGLTVWNLRSGFTDYLRQRDDEQLMRLTQMIERRAASDPQLQWLRANEREAMRELMDEFYGRQFHPLQSADFGHPPPRGLRPGQDPRPGPARPDWQRPPPPPPPPGTGGGALRDRVLIRDAQGQWVAGREPPSDAPKSVRAIKVNQVEVGTVTLVAEPVADSADLSFLRKQYVGLGLATLGTVAVALAAGFWLSSLWSRPLRALQQASRAIAKGRRDVQVAPAGSLEMAELASDINAMTAELARLESTRRTWIAQISHELRTPLSVLRGEIESIEDGVRQPTPALMGRLRDEVNQLTRLVDDLHTLSVAGIKGLNCTFTPGKVGPALAAVVQRFAPQAQQAGLSLAYTPPDNAPPCTAMWDFGRVEQLLANLLTNSLRYTQAPGRIAVRWHCTHGQVHVHVEDSAPGVSNADLPRLFDPLFRADTSRRRTPGMPHASGLGLSIVKSIAQAHHGQVSAHHSPLGGLEVHVTLPLQPDERQATP